MRIDECPELKYVWYNPRNIFWSYGPSRTVWYKAPPEPTTNDDRIQWFMETVFGDGIRISEDFYPASEIKKRY